MHSNPMHRFCLNWSEWRDLNPRPHGPEPCALPTALHPDIIIIIVLTTSVKDKIANQYNISLAQLIIVCYNEKN